MAAEHRAKNIVFRDDGVTILYVKLSNQNNYQKTYAKIIGQGANKYALSLDIDKTRVLMVPQRPYEKLSFDDEINVSRMLTKHGILNSNNIITKIYTDDKLTEYVVAYFSTNFAWLSERGIYVTEPKAKYKLFEHDKNETIRNWEDKIFISDDDLRANIAKWIDLCSPLVHDIQTLFKLNMLHGPGDDSDHYVVIKGYNDNYYIRYYGFDFESRYRDEHSIGTYYKYLPYIFKNYLSDKYSQINDKQKLEIYTLYFLRDTIGDMIARIRFISAIDYDLANYIAFQIYIYIFDNNAIRVKLTPL